MHPLTLLLHCCHQVIFLSQAHMTNHSYRELQGDKLKEKEIRLTQIFYNLKVVSSPM